MWETYWRWFSCTISSRAVRVEEKVNLTDFKEGYATKRAMTSLTSGPLLTRPIPASSPGFWLVRPRSGKQVLLGRVGEVRRGEDNCSFGGDPPESGQWEAPNHAVSFLHTLDIVHDAVGRAGLDGAKMCYVRGQGGNQGDAHHITYTRKNGR